LLCHFNVLYSDNEPDITVRLWLALFLRLNQSINQSIVDLYSAYMQSFRVKIRLGRIRVRVNIYCSRKNKQLEHALECLWGYVSSLHCRTPPTLCQSLPSVLATDAGHAHYTAMAA